METTVQMDDTVWHVLADAWARHEMTYHPLLDEQRRRRLDTLWESIPRHAGLGTMPARSSAQATDAELHDLAARAYQHVYTFAVGADGRIPEDLRQRILRAARELQRWLAEEEGRG